MLEMEKRRRLMTLSWIKKKIYSASISLQIHTSKNIDIKYISLFFLITMSLSNTNMRNKAISNLYFTE